MKTSTTFERRVLCRPRFLATLALVAVVSFGFGVLIVEHAFPAVMSGTGF